MRKETVLLFLIILLGAFLRFYQLGNVPLGFTWDEASITYDAWGIADWHRDQHAKIMPLVFRSYGDYKPPLMHYLLASIFLVTGVNEIAIRLISAVSGILLILIIYLISQELFQKNTFISLSSAFVIAASPWLIHMSRVGFEANVATTIIGFGIYLMLKGKNKLIYLTLGAFTLALSLYTYQSAKITAPLLLIWMTFWMYKKFHIAIKKIIITFIVFLFSSLPLLLSLTQGGLERGQQTLIFYENEKLLLNFSVVTRMIGNFFKHFSFDFLIYGKQPNLRNIVPGFGVLYPIDLIFIIVGVLSMLKKLRAELILLTGWIIIGLIPSIISTSSPHTIRSTTIIIPTVILISYGIWSLVKYVKGKYGNKVSKLSVITVFLIYSLFIIKFSIYYFNSYKIVSAIDFQFGYQEALLIAKQQLRTADALQVTDRYGQAYLYTLLNFHYTPEQFNQGVLVNVKFVPISWPNLEKNTVFVATPDEIPPDDPAVINLVKIPGTEEIVFVIARVP
jgi:4-amino-4-deoxy-L-arabinose transferase-like glycosyltransferase